MGSGAVGSSGTYGAIDSYGVKGSPLHASLLMWSKS